MTNDIRQLMSDYLDLSGVSQKELAEATDRHEMAISKTLRGISGSLSDVWADMLEATGMKLVMIPKDSDVNALELVRQKALRVRGTEKRLQKRSKSSGKRVTSKHTKGG